MAHVAEWKKEEVKELVDVINKYDVIGIVDLMNIPAKQLQSMRKSLNGKAVIRMSKINLINLALEDCNAEKTNIIDLSEHMNGQVALIATEMNPFKLYKILEDSKTSAPVKAGAIVDQEIVVPQGDTGITNLAFLGDLGKVGIQARPDNGKIFIQKDSVVVQEGEQVSNDLANVLSRLDINPLEVGIDLKAVYEEGSVYTSDLLAIDEEQTLADVQNAFRNAFNLSVNAAIPTDDTISTIITLAYTRAVNVGVEGAIMTSETSEPIIGLAQAKMLALASQVSGVEGALSQALSDKVANAAPVEVVDDTPGDDEPEDQNKDEKEEEAEPAAGLGLLF
jgi:large subunit ribosomal protein L10